MSTNANGPATRHPLSLPRLPVPDLRQTLDRYIASLEPFMLEDERKRGIPYTCSYARHLQQARTFENGIGQVLQHRLLALDRASPNNWLNDNIWINKAYLEWRAPLLINSNWWLAFNDDNTIPQSVLAGESRGSKAGITPWQMRRAAWIVHRVLDFKTRLDIQELHPETTRTGIWLRESVSKMFNTGRIPMFHCDTVPSPPPTGCPDALKLLLMVHNWCYTISVYHPPTPSTRAPQLMEPHEIESQIQAVVSDVEQRLANGETAIPFGALSADERDRWTENRQHLVSLHPQNQKNYHALLTSIMGLSLDHTIHTISSASSVSHSSQHPLQDVFDAHLHSIRSHSVNFSNRFFDKPFTIVVDPSTRAGATGEHSPCDALVPSIVAEYAIVEGVEVTAFEKTLSNVGGWERLDWIVDDRIQNECTAAQTRGMEIIDNSDDSVLWFEDYGTDWIKSVAKLSPDAYIQMALQLSWFKTHHEFTATYETVLTRMFKHGRTETLRTLTRDSRAWVLTMIDPQSTPVTQYMALQNAVRTHSYLTREAATGKGIDRHLLGLKLMLRPQEGEFSPLFEDELFEKSQQWKLSTSGLSAGYLFRGTGFGAVYNDGYGINYLAAPNMIKFGIESKFSSSFTSTSMFKQVIVDSLQEMKAVCSPENRRDSKISPHL